MSAKVRPPLAPWREVVHIELREGARGGRTWWLGLSCGHFAAKRLPGSDPARVIFRKPPCAPKRMRCIPCRVAAQKCAACGAPAECFGAYEGQADPGFACGTCCGHGNEDGWCKPLDELP